MPVFRPEDETQIRELLDALERPVDLLVAHGPEEAPPLGAGDLDFGAETQRIVEALADLSERVSYRVEDEPAPAASGGRDSRPGAGGSADGASSLRFERYPAVAVLPEGEDVGIRYYGLPWGYELGSLIGAVVEAGKRESSLAPESLEALAALDHDLAIDVFVTPTCPHCPPAVLMAYRVALASPRVRAAAIEATEFPQLADEMEVWSVPRIVVNRVPQWDGAVRERVFVERILAPTFG